MNDISLMRTSWVPKVPSIKGFPVYACIYICMYVSGKGCDFTMLLWMVLWGFDDGAGVIICEHFMSSLPMGQDKGH